MKKSTLLSLVITALSAVVCLAQTNPLDSDHTKTISIPVTYGGFGSWDVKKMHLQKGDVLTVNALEDNFHPVSDFQDKKK